MKFAKTVVFYLFAILLSVTLTIGVLLLGLKFYDARLLSHRHAASPDEDADEPTMRTMDSYPFTGGHIQAFKTERKPLWSNYYDDFDVTSGEYGFFIDFHLETPPPKQDNEIRIVLTGGSTAQGWGGRTNADMFYQLLPAKLNQELQQHGQNCKVTVINLAMGSSHIYQNFIALNKWAHPLQPDAIISFSGANEIAVPWSQQRRRPLSNRVPGGRLAPCVALFGKSALAENHSEILSWNCKADGSGIACPINVSGRLHRRLGRLLFSEQGRSEFSPDASGGDATALSDLR